MAVSTAGRPFTLTGRAVSVRRARDGGTAGSGRGAVGGRVPILIAGPGCWSSPGPAIAEVSRSGFRVVVANELDNIVNNKLINARILTVSVPTEAIAELQDAVESDPAILLTVDVGRGDVRARRGVVARFDIDLSAGLCPREPGHLAQGGGRNGGGGEDLAGRLRLAQQLISSADLADDARTRLQRRFAAICDAVKVPGADAARGAWRLDRLLAELARRTPDGR